jgi:hypothetical protein
MPHDSKQGQLHNHTHRNLRQQLTKKRLKGDEKNNNKATTQYRQATGT